ncbi:MAG: hypothetical protein BGO67_03340 [Alphaproteobacteria bacterium 41-28]|nr:MAG: hypothetical protein BGO67_03340 [Alphaproteobacteria bacterium 41-28]
MLKNVTRLSLSLFILFSSLSSLTYAGKNTEAFTSSENDHESGKVTLKMIRDADPSFFANDLEHEKNKMGKLSYSLASEKPEKFSSTSPSVVFLRPYVNINENYVDTTVIYTGNGYKVRLNLIIPMNLLSEYGKIFLETMAKEVGRFKAP